MTSLTQSPLADRHRSLGAKLVPFAGWEMPLQYSGIVEEHQAVRTSAGVFDVSHMGEFLVEGPGALALLQRTTPNDVSALAPGRIHYSSLLTPAGTFVDDILVYRRDESRFLVVVNAGNADKDFAWLREAAAQDASSTGSGGAVELRDASREIALVAVQGPRAVEVVESLYEGERRPRDLKYYGFLEGGRLASVPVAFLSRTGYTGEDGFEAYLSFEDAPAVWDAVTANAAVRPCGLGARDTLRLEAGMCLYGNDIDDSVTPVEAGLTWTVKLAKGDFTGRDVLVRQLEVGPPRRLVGLDVTGRGIARHGHVVRRGGADVGLVTSGTHSPTLGRPVAMALVESSCAAVDTQLSVDVRGREVEARVTALPFYSRKRGS